MPSKKKKFNARFPPARIKKIMQMDDEVGKVAQAVPVIISRTLELFVESLLKKAEVVTVARNAKTLTPSHLKQCILAEQRFDFLKDLVENIPDSQGDEDCSTPATDTPRSSSSNSPFIFPTANRGTEASSSTASLSRSSSINTPSTPTINESPPVIIANNIQPHPQGYLQPVPPFYQSQEQYESVIVQPQPSVQNAHGASSNLYIPPHSSDSDARAHQNSHQPVKSVNQPVPTVLSHFEYLPNNLHYAPSTASSNNGVNFNLHQTQARSESANNNNGPNTSVIVSPQGHGSSGFYQRQPSLHE